jgi:hypothetical protein
MDRSEQINEPTRRCAEHGIEHPEGEWCPFCLEDAQREAKAMGEMLWTSRKPRRAARIDA